MKELCRDLVGLRVKLLCDLETRGGTKFSTGEVLHVDGTYRGRFSLSARDAEGKRIWPGRSISRVSRRDFERLP